MATIVTLKPVRVSLSSGPIVVPAGTVMREDDYTAAEWAAITEALPSVAFALGYPAGATIDEAAAECVALRARAGDSENQSQDIMQSAVIEAFAT